MRPGELPQPRQAPAHPHGLKDACSDSETVQAWWERWPHANIGVRTGSASGIFVLDIDSPQAEADLQALRRTIPADALRQRTGRGGQVFFSLPDFQVKNSTGKIAPDIDIRGEGGYVVVPPSRHANGAHYQWITEGEPGPAPDWLLALLAPTSHTRPAPAAPGLDPYLTAALEGEADRVARAEQGSRNHSLNRAAFALGQLQGRGLARAVAEEALVDAALRAGLKETEARRTFASGWSAGTSNPRGPGMDDAHHQAMVEAPVGPDPAPPAPRIFPRTDAGNAELFAYLHGDRVRYDHQRGRWLIWQGHRFAADVDGHIRRLAKQAARTRYLWAADMADPAERRREADFAITSESRARQDAMLTLAQAEPPIADAGDAWDADPWLLGVTNGVVDLRSGQLRPGRPDDKITLCCGTHFDPRARAPRFERFLREVFQDDEVIMAFVARAVGYALTGLTREQCFFLLHGAGSNGKSVLLGVLLALLGDYGYAAPFSTFEYSRGGAIPNDLAQLAGRRLVVASETNEGTRLDEARLKALTGGEAQTARFLNREFFTFIPQCTIMLAANHRPRVNDDSRGFWRRVRLLPFGREFCADEIDLTLADTLKAELSGILAWALRGCLDWQTQGLNPPAQVLAATADYQADSDPLAEFVAERLCEDANLSVRGSTAYARYRQWAEEHKLPERDLLSSRVFGERLSARFRKERQRAGVVYFGLGCGHEAGRGTVVGAGCVWL